VVETSKREGGKGKERERARIRERASASASARKMRYMPGYSTPIRWWAIEDGGIERIHFL